MDTTEFWRYCERERDTRSPVESAQILGEMMLEHEDNQVHSALSFMLGQQVPFDAQIGIGSKKTRKAAGKAFNVDKWKKGHRTDREKELGDLSLALEEVDRPTTITQPERIDVARLHQRIHQLAEASGDSQVNQLADLFSQLKDPHVVAFAVLGPDKDTSLGMSWKTFISALQDPRLDFGYVARDFKKMYGRKPRAGPLYTDLCRGEEQIELTPFDRVAPQLASSADIPADTLEWYAETKFDGFRALVHHTVNQRDGYRKQTEVHSRACRDVTDSLPEMVEYDWPEVDFVVDGECLAVHPETGDEMDFQKVLQRSNRTEDIAATREDIHIDIRLFDILHYDGDDLRDQAQWERKLILKEEFPDEIVAESHSKVQEAIDEALAAGHEGVIVKDESAPYYNERDRSWRKVKKDRETVDVRVTDTVQATGSLQDKLGDALGAVHVETADGIPLGKVGSGFSEANRTSMWNAELEGKIIEVSFFELQESDSEYGLRFPAFEKIRHDGDADSLERLKEIAW